MQSIHSPSTVAQTFLPVKPSIPSIPSIPSNSMIHHKYSLPPDRIIVSYKRLKSSPPYGVSPSYRVLSPGLLLKKYNLVRDCLAGPLGLTNCQRELTLRLLRLWAYYGKVYPKESQITEDPGCSKATFWRTIQLLKGLGLVHVVNRYVIRPHAQISNLYRLDKLVLVIARYLAEQGTPFREKWLEPYLVMPGRLFWGAIAAAFWPPGGRGPVPLRPLTL